MKNEKAESKKLSDAAQKSDNVAVEKFPDELSAPRWSVITFEKCAAKSLTYAEAAKKLQKLSRQNIAGLCIVTDEAAEKLK